MQERSARERPEESGALRLHQPQTPYKAITPHRYPGNAIPGPQPSSIGNTNVKSSERDSQGAASPNPTPELRSALKMSHRKAKVPAPEPNQNSLESSSGQDSQAASLEAATVPQGSFVSLKNFKPSNPFAKKADTKENADDKNDSILQSLKKMQACAPEIKRKADNTTVSQQRPAKMGKVA